MITEGEVRDIHDFFNKTAGLKYLEMIQNYCRDASVKAQRMAFNCTGDMAKFTAENAQAAAQSHAYATVMSLSEVLFSDLIEQKEHVKSAIVGTSLDT